MVEGQDVRKCKTCNYAGRLADDSYRLCHHKYCKVWAESVACRDYDDTCIF